MSARPKLQTPPAAGGRDALLDALARGATVLCATKRLTRDLRARHAARMGALGKQAWSTPDAFTLGGWVRRTWDAHVDSDACSPADAALAVLDGARETALWETVVGGSKSGASLMHTAGAANDAARAWQLLEEHRLGPKTADAASGEGAAFREWAAAFDAACKAGCWITGPALAYKVADLVAAGEIPVAQEFVFAGFDEMTPAADALRAALAKAGVQVRMDDAEKASAGNAVRAGFADTTDEIRAAARWARAILDSEPQCRVGVVVPGLQEQRALVERVFLDIFHPDAPGTGLRGRAFNISAGTPLAGEPVVHAALLLLALGGGPVAVEEAGVILRSPYVAGAREEAGARAALDCRLRERGSLEVTADAAARAADPNSRIAKLLSKLAKEGKALRNDALPSEWARHFADALAAAGWPGDRKRDTREAQALKSWQDLLGELESLDAVVGAEPRGAALARLRRMADEKMFQPEGSDAPVQILGVLEASGFGFDRLWVAGMHDGAWPAPASPNPYLPLRLQAQHRMGLATAGIAADFARKVTDRLMAAAPQIVVSWPRRADDADLRPSPLIRAITECDPSAIPVSSALCAREAALASARLESIEDARGPELAHGARAHGGTGHLSRMALCPFSAFATHRLEATEPPAPAEGLDPMARGNLVHRALSFVWSELRDSQRLNRAKDAELEKLIARAVEAAVVHVARDYPQLRGKLGEIERQRLAGVVREWLDFEREGRGEPFEVIVIEDAPPGASEEGAEFIIELGGIKFKGRRDRVDRLAGDPGRLLIIDYKTGQPTALPKAWDAERPSEPQLPVYAVEEDARAAAVAFGKVRVGECRFYGFGDTKDIGGGITPEDMPAKRAAWRASLERLGTNIREGLATVDPLPGACDRCSLSVLCRVSEAISPLAAEARAEEAANGAA